MATETNIYKSDNSNETFITEDLFKSNTEDIELFDEYVDGPRLEALTGRLEFSYTYFIMFKIS